MDGPSLNAMLEGRVKDLAGRKISGGRKPEELGRVLGLHPEPPRTDLNAEITGVIQRDGYRVEKLRYESRPGVPVTAHLYLPDGAGPFPIVLNPHGHWAQKKMTPWVQARGISLALCGFAALIVDSPGFLLNDDIDSNERRTIGSHDDPFLAMGAPVQGQYVWDLVRGLDYCSARSDIDPENVGITGAAGGGIAAMLAFAFDERIGAAVPVCAASSLTVVPHNGCFCYHLPNLLNVGDRADVLALRAPSPIMLIGATRDSEFPPEGMTKTYEKLKPLYKKAEGSLRLELVEGDHDYNRRMREAMLAFFCEHLKREPARGHLPEPRPLTDGTHNPFEGGTEQADDPEFVVTSFDRRDSLTFRSLLEKALKEPYPEAFQPAERLVAWAKYGRLDPLGSKPTLGLHDHPLVAAPSVSPSIALPVEEIDLRLCILLGLSVGEFLAQILHQTLAGKPEGWESAAVVGGGDAISSMIASVKTLVHPAKPEDIPTKVVAEGPISSMVAHHLRLLRPDLEIETSHTWTSWSDVLESNTAGLVQPGARYLEWPFQPPEPAGDGQLSN